MKSRIRGTCGRRNANGTILLYPAPVDQVHILRQTLQRTLVTLRRIEWRGLAQQQFCWLCDRTREDGHASGCPIAEAIAEAEGVLGLTEDVTTPPGA